MIREVPLDGSVDFMVDRDRYQRPESRAQVRAIAAEWDDRLARAVKVVERTPGTFWIIDGAHTAMAAVLAHRKTLVVDVIEAKEDEEPALFAKMNGSFSRSRRRTASARDVWKALEAAKDPVVMKAIEIAAHRGYSIAKNGGPWRLTCFRLIEELVKSHPDAFASGLNLLRTFDNDAGPTTSLMSGASIAAAECSDPRLWKRLAGRSINAANNGVAERLKASGAGGAGAHAGISFMPARALCKYASDGTAGAKKLPKPIMLNRDLKKED